MILCEFNWLFEEADQKPTKKIITKKGYIKAGKEVQERNLKSILEDSSLPFEERFVRWKEKTNEIMEKNKIKIKKRNQNKTIRQLMRTRRSVKRQISTTRCKERKDLLIQRIRLINEHIKEEESHQYKRKIDKVVSKLKAKGGINGANTWEVLNQVKGRREEKATAVTSKEGKIIEEPEEIMKRQKEYFLDLLTLKKCQSEEEAMIEQIVNEQFDSILEMESRLSPLFTTINEVEESIRELKEKKCADGAGWKNEIMIHGGEGMEECLLTLFNEMEKERCTPEDWNEMVIKSLHKKGKVADMENKRGIFITDVISKVYEKVLKKRNKEKVDSRVSRNQVGGKKDRSAADHSIVLVDTLQRNKRINRKTYLVFGDAVKCFDKLWLRDSLVELYKAGVPTQDVAMLYKMNKEAVIKVRTPLGETEPFQCKEIVKQGTIWGPEMCCIEADSINRIGEDCESYIGEVAVGVLGYVDDLLGAGFADKIRKVIRNMRRLEIEKKFTFGSVKTKYMVIDTGNDKEEPIVEEIEQGIVQQTDEYEYLGFWVNKKGDCTLHIYKKGKKVMGEVNAIKSLGSKENVGPLYVNTRLFLYLSLIHI